ncbi:MAG: MFS transporter, partial [Gammaproteobacteria bacterium]|nr:MFS transporter [Gammaproteobacteria bacterium]
TFVAISVWSLTTFYAVWLLQKLWQEQGIALSHFGYLWAAYMIAAAIAGQVAERVERAVGTTTLLIVVGVMPAVGYAGLAVTGPIGGVIVALTFFIARGLGLVVLKNAFNRRVPSRYRATANSLVSFGFRGSFVVTGPFVGWLLDAYGMQITLEMLAVASVAIFATVLVPLIGAVRAERLLAASPG